MVKKYQFREVGDPVLDEEHQTYSVSFTDSQGAVRKIDWALATAAESRQMLAKHAQIQGQAAGAVPDRVCGEDSEAGCREEAEEETAEEGVSCGGCIAPGTAAEAKPAKRVSEARTIRWRRRRRARCSSM